MSASVDANGWGRVSASGGEPRAPAVNRAIACGDDAGSRSCQRSADADGAERTRAMNSCVEANGGMVADGDSTEAREVEQILRDSERRLRIALQAGKMGTWDWVIATGRVEWSEGLEEIHGRSRGSFRGTVDDALVDVHPDDKQSLQESLRAALENRSEYHASYRILTPDGEVRWLETRGTLLCARDGTPERMIGVCSDITSRKLAERALQHSELRYRQLIQCLPAAVYACDLSGRITLYNEAAAALWGRKPVLGSDLWSGSYRIFAPDGREIPLAEGPMAVTLRTGKAVRGCEVIIERPDGSRRNVLPYPEPLFDAAGRLVGAVNMLVDISALRQAAELVRVSEERFRLMADASPTLVWLSGPDKRCFWFNRSWLEFRGRSLEQETCGGWVEGVHPDDVQSAVKQYGEAFDARREFQLEYRLRRFDGAYRWMLDVGRPLYGPGGEFTGYVGSCFDVTDQALARQSLERQQTLLEEAVVARTQELQRSNERLRIAERMASLGTLSAGLGHDMGNLLVPVRVRLESLSKADLSPELQEDVKAIRSAAEYLQRLAAGLRMLSIDPENTLRGEATDLAAWWAEAALLLRNVLPRGVRIESDLDSARVHVAIPRAILTQVVFNLVQNAGDAMRSRGTGRVLICAAHIDARTASLRITDDGPGMAPDVRARCMEPFFTTKTRGMSTGLGLALVYGLICDAGGSVIVESEENRGTTFELRLPAVSGASVASKPGFGRRAIVHVSDARMRAFVSAELSAMGFELIPAASAAGAAELAVCDEPGVTLPGLRAGSPVVLLGPSTTDDPTVIVVGEKPSVRAIRNALGEAARSAPDAA